MLRILNVFGRQSPVAYAPKLLRRSASATLVALGRQSPASATLVSFVASVVALVASMVLNAAPIHAQVQPPEVEWQKTFGGTNDDGGESVQQTADGGYVVAGSTSSFGAGQVDVYLVKTDAAGNLLWQMTFGGANFDWGYSVQQTADSGYVVAGGTESSGAGNFDVYLVKTDAAGNLLWQQTYGGVSYDEGYSVQQTQDGGYIIAGKTISFGAGSYDLYLVKTDAAGNLEWEKTFGGIGWDEGRSVQQTKDGGYIVAGQTGSFGAGNFDVYLVKTDAAGNKLWQMTFGGANSDRGASVQQTADGGYIVAGQTGSFGVGGDIYLVKTDDAGNLLWQMTFGGANFDWGYSVQQTADGGYIVAGVTGLFSASGLDAYLVKTDSLGTLLWQKTLGGTNSDEGHSVQQTADGGYILAGWTKSFGAGQVDAYLVKLGPDVEVEYPFIRGDASVDGRIDITDAIVTLNWLFVDSSIPICVDAADFDDGGEVNLSDPIAALNFLFLGTATPKPPFPGVGFDPTPDELGCNLKRP